MIRGGGAAGLYVHIPFCSRICPYCDFAVTRGNRDKRRAFVDRLVAEFSLCADFPGTFDTIYFGGGTPSILEPAELGEIIAAARDVLQFDDTVRITVEANPEDASPQRLGDWRQLGVEGISFGIQSFSPQELRFLGRRHTSDEARRAVEAALATGFEWVSIDLIYGLPDQSIDQWRQSLATGVELAPHHLSCYQLTVHEGTPFHRREQRGLLRPLPDRSLGDFFRETHSALAARGYPPYEVSNFARSQDHRSRHNQKYWNHTPYLGVGPSAHSFDGRERWWNERDVATYQQRIDRGERPIADRETLDHAQLALEDAMLSLRTSDGIDIADFRQRHGVDLEERNRGLFDELRRSGLLHTSTETLVLTMEGLAVVDGITPRLLLEGGQP